MSRGCTRHIRSFPATAPGVPLIDSCGACARTFRRVRSGPAAKSLSLPRDAPVRLASCHNIADLRTLARQQLPGPVFHFLDGGAESEGTQRSNTEAFDEIKLVPRCLVDVASVYTATRVLGQEIAWPLLCSPTGGSRIFHPDGELAVARAAAKSGTFYGLSTNSTYSLEDVAAASPGPKLFQLYIFKDRDMTRELIERCKRSGYQALCLTVDVPVVGKRERDLRSGFGIPIRMSARLLRQLCAPAWLVAGTITRRCALNAQSRTARRVGQPPRANAVYRPATGRYGDLEGPARDD